MSIRDEARQEAERRWTRDIDVNNPLSGPERSARRVGFELGALWASEQVDREPSDVDVEAQRAELAAEIHEAWEFQYDECDHGTYRGGHLNGEPYAMCEITASRIVRRRAYERQSAALLAAREVRDDA